MTPRLTSDQARQLAETSGLRQMGVRPPLGRYIAAVWTRRSFIWNLSASRAYTRNQGSYLGQAWNVLRPILDAGVYVIIFGVVLQVTEGVLNRAAFITVGTFVYRLFATSVSTGAASIPDNIDLVRSHQFPRAIVPLATTMTEVVLFGPVLAAMLVVSFLTGFLPNMAPVNPTWSWLLIPFAAALLALFALGLGMLFSRLGARTPDIANILPFFLGLGQFASAVMFIPEQRASSGSFHYHLLQDQPVRVFIELFRGLVGAEGTIPLSGRLWTLAVAYAVGVFVIGVIVFWRREETYGRD